MSYINENNIYSSRKSNESQCNVYGKTPIEAVSYNTVSSTQDQQYGMQNSNTSCMSDNTQNFVSPSNTMGHAENDCSSSSSNISVTCNCNSECNSKKECDFNCSSNDNCCNCDVPEYNPSLARPICTFLDYICDETKASGSTLFFNINTSTTPTNYNITSQLVPICCNSGGCSITADTKFTVESSKVTLKNFKFTGTISTSDILVNGNPVLGVTTTPTGISVTVDPSILDSDCSSANKGTKVSLLLNALKPWQFLAKYEICGKTYDCGDTCKFKVSIENVVTLPEILSDPSTFVCPEICLPSNDLSRPIIINIDFNAIGQLINPVLTGSTTTPCVSLAGKLMITTGANLTSVQNTKVCFPAILPNVKKPCSK